VTSGVAEPLDPRRKWLVITIATILLVPAFWALLAGLVADAVDTAEEPAAPGALALGLAILPFVFMTLAFGSGHRRAPGAVLKAMGLCLVVGLTVSALAMDGVTGIIAGVGAGGVVALRADEDHSRRYRILAVVAATLYTFVLVRTVGAMALLPAPVLPLTGIGVADHLSERAADRAAGKG
jgi:hypothetical protein